MLSGQLCRYEGHRLGSFVHHVQVTMRAIGKGRSMSRRKWFQVLAVTVVAAFLSVLSGVTLAQRNSNNVVPRRFICLVDDSEDAWVIGQATARATGGAVGHVYSHALNGFSIQVPPGIGVAHLRAHGGVIRAEPDLIMHTCATLVPTGVNRIDAEGVLAAGINCSDVGIAIIDTGIQTDHPDLHVEGGTCFSGGTEDPLGYDDDNGHGTHCAGIAAANGTIVGVAPGARLYAVKVLDASGSGYLSDIIAGVNWVTAYAFDVDGRQRIHVANMSLGGQGQSELLYTALSNCPVVFAVAAGNSSADIYGRDGKPGTNDDFIPAAYGGTLPNVHTISAMVDTDGRPGGRGPSTSYGRDDSFASFSNYSRAGAIAYIEPGVNIYSTYLNSGYATMSGTSMASPHAAGLFALELAASGSTKSVLQKDSVYGLRQPSGDPDGQYEPLGYAIYSLTPIAPTLHIGDLDGTATRTSKTWQAKVTIAVHDGGHAPVSGATVVGTWSNGVKSTGATGSSGTCTVSSGSLTSSTVTFTVTGVTKTGYTYNSGSNHDVDGGSNGTTITVKKP